MLETILKMWGTLDFIIPPYSQNKCNNGSSFTHDNQMSRNGSKRILGDMRPAKIQIRLRIR